MDLVFVGVGEAFHTRLATNCHLVKAKGVNLLLDCGYSAAQALWQYNEDPSFLDAIYISHQHYDHFGGLPPVVMRMWEDKRTKPLSIICQKGFKHPFRAFLEFAFKGFPSRFQYPMEVIEARDGASIEFKGLRLSFEKTVHSADNLAIKLEDGENRIAYTGDGSPLQESRFYDGLDLLIAETYLSDAAKIGHSSIVSAVKFARSRGVKTIALTHMSRHSRLPQPNELASAGEGIKVIIPEPMQSWP